jgi:intein/homing endonuclease
MTTELPPTIRKSRKEQDPDYFFDVDITHNPLDTVGLFTFIRTYARRIDNANPNSYVETWAQCVKRLVIASNEQLGCKFNQNEKKELFEIIYNLKATPAGRFLWQLGTEIVNKNGLLSLQNCAFVVVNHPIKPFTWAMNFLMCGAGVGFRILPTDVDKLPLIKYATITREDTKDADFIVPDSRAGWVKLLGRVLKAHFYSGGDFTYSCMLIRSKGALIKGFGGKASGPDVLCEGMAKISTLLNSREGQFLRPIDALDVMNIVGYIVVAGNVRRCIPKGSLVYTKQGLIPIELVKVGQQVLTVDGYKRTKQNYYQGRQRVIRIMTRRGFFDCTPNHRVCILESGVLKWVKAMCLLPGDKLVRSTKVLDGRETMLPGVPIVVTPDIAWLMGSYIHKKLVFDNTYDLNEAERIVRENFNTHMLDSFLTLYMKDYWTGVDSCILEGSCDVRSSFLSAFIGDSAVINRGDLSIKTFKDINNLYQSIGIDTVMSYDRIIIDFSGYSNKYSNNYCEVVSLDDTNSSYITETYDLEIAENHNFFCEGYLVHNSAEIALGDCNDEDYLRAKRWDLGNIPNTRIYSNNSVICNDIEQVLGHDDFWNGYNGNGEPYGLININLSKSCGRLGETKYADPDVEGYNPCAEQSLCNYETCCLGELYLPNIKSKDELFLCAKYIYRICKHSLRLPCPYSAETESIVHKNMRMGIGVTGYLQSTEEQKSWLGDCYTYIRSYDKEYSKRHKLPPSIKLTTVKPSGTLSLVAGTTPGVHPGYAQYYIRRIRVASEHNLIALAKDHGYHVEYVENFDGTFDRTTMVVEFPCQLPSHTIFAKDCTAIQQLEYVKRLQTEWSDNSVSCCLTGDHYVYTDTGPRRLDELVTGIEVGKFEEHNITIYNQNGDRESSYYNYNNGLAPTIRLELSNGTYIQGTAEHKLKTCGNEWIQLKDITKEHYIQCIYGLDCWSLYSTSPNFMNMSRESAIKRLYELCENLDGARFLTIRKNHVTLDLALAIVNMGIESYVDSNGNLVLRGFEYLYELKTFLLDPPAKCIKYIDILSITHVEDRLPTYDISTSITHSYVVNGIVSHNTVYYKMEELDDIKNWLRENYNNSIKTVSFLLHSNHGFKQAPYEEITEDEYKEKIKNIRPISNTDYLKYYEEAEDLLTDKSLCAGGACPLR